MHGLRVAYEARLAAFVRVGGVRISLGSAYQQDGTAYQQDGTDWPVFKPNRFLSIRDLAINFLEPGTVPSGKRRDPPTEVKHDVGEPPALLLVLNSGCQPQ